MLKSPYLIINFKTLITCIIIFIILSCSDKKNNLDIYNNQNIESLNKVFLSKIDKNAVFLNQVKANGKINAIYKTELRFNQSGKISNINFFNGQKVGKNQLISNLDNYLLKNSVEKAKIELKKAENKFEENKINFSNEFTESNIQNIKLKSGLLEAQNNLERAILEYNQTILKAPFSGTITNLTKKEGEFIDPSEVLCTILNPKYLEVSFSVLENEFQFVSVGQNIEIETLFNNEQFLNGIVSEVNPIVDKNGLIQVKAKIITESTEIIDGMNVQVLINKPLENIIVVPKSALVLRSNKEVIFTYEKGVAKWNYVEILSENDNSYAIQKGLKKSDTIIVSGNLNLAHDTKVDADFINENVRN